MKGLMPSDKGHITVILNIEDYKTKINNLVDPDTYNHLVRCLNQQSIRKRKALTLRLTLGHNKKKKI